MTLNFNRIKIGSGSLCHHTNWWSRHCLLWKYKNILGQIFFSLWEFWGQTFPLNLTLPSCHIGQTFPLNLTFPSRHIVLFSLPHLFGPACWVVAWQSLTYFWHLLRVGSVFEGFVFMPPTVREIGIY